MKIYEIYYKLYLQIDNNYLTQQGLIDPVLSLFSLHVKHLYYSFAIVW